MFEPDKTKETRMFVKILFSESGKSALANVYYFRNEMRVDFFQRWKWYFEYRAALLRVKYPKAFIQLSHGPYMYQYPEDLYKVKVRNRYRSDKTQLTKLNNMIVAVQKNWNELFPIEENPNYTKLMDKYNYYKKQVEISQAEYDSVFSSNDH